MTGFMQAYANALEHNIKDTGKFKNTYTKLGVFYEHNNHPKEPVFLGSDLELFLQQHGTDPALVKNHGLQNEWRDYFKGEIELNRLLIFSLPHKLSKI